MVLGSAVPTQSLPLPLCELDIHRAHGAFLPHTQWNSMNSDFRFLKKIILCFHFSKHLAGQNWSYDALASPDLEEALSGWH